MEKLHQITSELDDLTSCFHPLDDSPIIPNDENNNFNILEVAEIRLLTPSDKFAYYMRYLKKFRPDLNDLERASYISAKIDDKLKALSISPRTDNSPFPSNNSTFCRISANCCLLLKLLSGIIIFLLQI